ncbi:MAG: radical SAM protein [Planctomycetes bacterium]|nr:radical SAM protein [Planctomycetota bacterium]
MGGGVHRRFLVFVQRNCPRRRLEAARFQRYFEENGLEPATSVRDADLILIHTCGGFQSTEERSLRTIRRALRERRRDAQLLVTGCLTKIHREALDGDYAVILPEEIDALDGMIGARVRLAEIPEAHTAGAVRDLEREPILLSLRYVWGPTPAFALAFVREWKRRLFGRPFRGGGHAISVGRGCLGECTYCAIRFVDGDLRSKAPEAIIAEFREGLACGRREFVLVGQDTGAYGQDRGTSSVDLLEEILSLGGEFRLVIKDFNPQWLIRFREPLLRLLERAKGRVADLQIPIQSGSDRILERMARRYRIAEVKAAIAELRARAPEVILRTHMMVGFPGETEDDFGESRRLLEDLPFLVYLVNTYEDRPRTPASRFEDKIPDRVKFRRRRELEDLSARRAPPPASAASPPSRRATPTAATPAP